MSDTNTSRNRSVSNDGNVYLDAALALLDGELRNHIQVARCLPLHTFAAHKNPLNVDELGARAYLDFIRQVDYRLL